MRSIPPAWLSQESTWLSPSLFALINKVKQDWFIVGLDKVPHIPTIICKYLAKAVAEARLNGPEFILSEMSTGKLFNSLMLHLVISN